MYSGSLQHASQRRPQNFSWGFSSFYLNLHFVHLLEESFLLAFFSQFLFGLFHLGYELLNPFHRFAVVFVPFAEQLCYSRQKTVARPSPLSAVVSARSLPYVCGTDLTILLPWHLLHGLLRCLS